MSTENLRIYLFNVGAGDHIMIEFPDSSIGIIDSFFNFNSLKEQEAPAITYLRYLISKKKTEGSNKKISIAFLCLSHADQDHIKNINQLFSLLTREAEHIELENLLLFGGIDLRMYRDEIEKLNMEMMKGLNGDALEEFEKRAVRYSKDLNAIATFKEDWREMTGKSEFYFNDYKEFKLYNSKRPYKAMSIGPIARIVEDQGNSMISELISEIYERVQKFNDVPSIGSAAKINLKFNRNALSAMLSIYAHGYKLMFLGDATSKTIEDSLEDISKRDVHGRNFLFNPYFVKVGHHGAKGSTTTKIWESLLSPTNDVFFGISAGNHQGNLHPHDEFFLHVDECCASQNKNYHIFRTNECSDCKNKPRTDGEIDLDFWFQYHGCPISDIRLSEAFEKDSPNFSKMDEIVPSKNLLAYIFEFQCNDSKKELKVYRGVSERIGNYAKCSFSRKSDFYC